MAEDKYKYKLGDRVYFSMGENMPKGWCKIAGCSTEPLPALGRGWIVELEEPRTIDPKVYPFTHIVVFDNMFCEPPKAS
jgi:hypothetical protein